jgi:hypothetical protein
MSQRLMLLVFEFSRALFLLQPVPQFLEASTVALFVLHVILSSHWHDLSCVVTFALFSTIELRDGITTVMY